jgi:hypothetical protein
MTAWSERVFLVSFVDVVVAALDEVSPRGLVYFCNTVDLLL